MQAFSADDSAPGIIISRLVMRSRLAPCRIGRNGWQVASPSRILQDADLCADIPPNNQEEAGHRKKLPSDRSFYCQDLGKPSVHRLKPPH